MSATPTILVKKADGSTVRMTLAEAKKLSQPKNPPSSLPAAAAPSASEDAGPDRLLPLATPAAASQPAPSRDKPLLEHEIQDHEVPHRDITGAPDYEAAVARIVAVSGAVVPAELRTRARSLIVSALKGIRDQEQFQAYARQAPNDGGLGWTPETIRAVWSRIEGERANASRLPLPAVTQSLSTTTPVKAIFLDEARAQASAASFSRPPQPAGENPRPEFVRPAPAGGLPIPPPAARPGMALSRPVLHDVAPAREARNSPVTGPIEEIQTFSLKDWRRLGATPRAAREALFAKFSGWKEESLLLFLDIRSAWRESPLVREYRSLAAEAVNSGRTMREAAGSQPAKDRLTDADIMEIVELNSSLRV
ncbi:MAG: hypothetical protein UY92_C0009G0058 [Candidatus Magasanikbacteria bacterium GW2011_GWA2_56_11]|uniref:Uncharacterized protein n=1 Tax=Candidatus Magasanikbacteria bacterium GW2011_GWA2_56_11 TaxID=1619044 RepID=A0A0G2B9V9_9BACT|nr:MAG: hypothetical protein UY92_C0009G0058 [Candidatus Magasanikbacteria bacterium GW2011_GWA2_56_11]